MAKKAIKKQKSMEETLWDSANKLRGKVESSEYKHVVLGLIFLKFASDKFEKRKQELIEEGKKEYTEMVEFYTPKSIVNLIATMIEPYKGKIYDPCCGSGGMFVQSIKFIESHHGNKKNLAIYGQEYTTTTYKLAKMNLAIRGISGNLGDVAENTFVRDQHKDLKADYIMANPPFNQKQWRADNELTDDARWNGYEVPPTGNANYGWILHMVSKLSENGAAGFLLANGALSGGGDEYKIRRKLIENGLVEAILILPQNMFYTTNISVTIWVLNKNKKVRSVEHDGVIKKYRNREKEVLFMDLRQWGEPFEKKYTQFSEDDIAKISATYHNWQSASQNDEGRIMKDECRVMNEKKHLNSELATQHSAPNKVANSAFSTYNSSLYRDIPEFCYSANFDEIKKKDFSLVPSKYIEFVNRDENIDFDVKMKTLQSDFSALLKEEEKSKADLLKVFKELGYEIK